MLSFYKQQTYFSQIVSKKAKITILLFMKNSKNNNIISFEFTIQYFAYPKERTLMSQTRYLSNRADFVTQSRVIYYEVLTRKPFEVGLV